MKYRMSFFAVAAALFAFSPAASAAGDPMFDRGVSAAFQPSAVIAAARAGAPLPKVLGALLPVPDDASTPDQQEPASMFGDCGPFGIWCESDESAVFLPQLEMGPRAVLPLNGFGDLGGAGATGDIDGPMSKGNGTYRILQSESYVMSLRIMTGYMNLTMTLRRDPAGKNKDTMTVQGLVWKDGKWVNGDGESVIALSYNAQRDAGRINWVEHGQSKSEGFWGGQNRDGRMTIEFGGGYDHDFKRR